MQKLLTTVELADLLGVAESTVRRWRHEWDWKHEGPAPVKIGRTVRYRHEDVEAYIASCEKAS